MTGPLADDLWLYFRCWLVAQGKKAFDLALGDPGSLASLQPYYGGAHGPQPLLDEMLYITTKPLRAKCGGKPPTKQIMADWTPPPGTDFAERLE